MPHANIVCPAYDVQHALGLALVRYERLCSPPKWMTVPLCSSVASYERARDHAIDTGNTARAEQIQGWLDEEWRRRELLAQWKGEPITARMLPERMLGENWKGRTLYAWSELLSRMRQARAAAVEASILDRTSQVYVAISDRIRDVEHRCEVARRRQVNGEPAVA